MNGHFLNFVGLRENPFHVSPDPRFYYSTPARDTALTELMFGIEARQGLLVLTGEAGTGKTSILNQIIDWLRQRRRSTAFIFHTRVEPIGLLRLILTDFGVSCASTCKSDLIKTLHHWLLQRQAANDLPVLILDEAQALPPQTLNEIRLILSDETPRGKLLQIILSGQPELEEKLRLLALRQLRQRIMSHSRLPALTEKETAAYIWRRLAVAGCSDTSVFPQEVVQSIYAISRGIPRVVNLLCERALICAYGEQRRVISPEMIQRTAAEFDLCSNPFAATANETQPKDQYVAAPLPAAEQRDVAEAPPPAVPEREAVPALARAAVAAATAAPSVGAVPAAAAFPVPVTPPAAQTVAAGPVTPVVRSDATPETPARRRRYWRKHRSRSVVARIARNSVSTITQAWETCWGILGEWVGRASRALFPVVGKKTPVSATKESLTEECWMQIEFDIVEKLHPRAAQKQAQIAVKEESTPAAAPVMPAPSRNYWRKHRPSSTVVVSARNSISSAKRMWSAVSEPSVEYVRSVVKSFVRDCRVLFRASLVLTPAAGVSASVDGSNGKPRSTVQRNAIALVHWLQQPMRPPRVSSRGSKLRGKY
jgi:type II secretory pathway predicted ATPase ExeA